MQTACSKRTSSGRTEALRTCFTRAILAALVSTCVFAGMASAQSVPDSLWLGTDNQSVANIFNVTKTGSVTRTLGPREGTGLAISLGANLLYVSTSVTATIDRYNLSNLSNAGSITQAPNTTFGEDMAFDGTSLYRSGVFDNVVWQVDPATGAAVQFITTANGPLGVAYTGSTFYVSEFNTGAVRQYTLAGVPTGLAFTPGPLTGPVGGLAWDTCTGTLWLGSLNRVYNIDPTTGAILTSFATPETPRFVDGLEYQGGGCPAAAVAVAVPTLSSTVALLLGLLLALGGAWGLARRARA